MEVQGEGALPLLKERARSLLLLLMDAVWNYDKCGLL